MVRDVSERLLQPYGTAIDGFKRKVWVDKNLPKTKPIIVGICYHPPKKVDFFNVMEDSCLTCDRFVDYECKIMGDFNVDYKNINSDSQLHVSLKHYMNMFDLSQILSHPTRITGTNVTVLDLILVSDLVKILNSGVLDFGVSDHQMTHRTHKCKRTPINEHNGVKLQSPKNYSKVVFGKKTYQIWTGM